MNKLYKFAAANAGEGELLGKSVYSDEQIFLIEFEGKMMYYSLCGDGISDADYITQEELQDLRGALV